MYGGEENCTYFFLICVKSEGMRPLRRKRHKLINNIKMDFKEISWGGGWIDMTYDKNKW
jgi:hypothetical protein